MKVVTVDHRERADTLCETLKQVHGFEVRQAQLELGDYHMPPDIVVERKTTADFCVSLLDRRLFDQAFRLVERSRNAIMLVEGKSFLLGHDLDIRPAAVRGALVTLAQTYRLPVLRTVDEQDTAWHLNQLFE